MQLPSGQHFFTTSGFAKFALIQFVLLMPLSVTKLQTQRQKTNWLEISGMLKIKLVALTSLLLIYISPLAFAQANDVKVITDRILRISEDLFSTEQLVGLQTAVYSGGAIVGSHNLGYADLEHGVAVSDGSRFEIASVNKTFTGLALLELEQQGQMNLDQAIQAYVPEFPAKPEGIITPRQLAGALGGVRHYDDDERTPSYYAKHYEDPLSALELFKDDPLVSKPGSEENYSSYAYVLLAAAIQQATGIDYQDYITQSILDPLGLVNTGFIDVRYPMENRSRNYTFIDLYTREVFDELHSLPTVEHSANTGAGNMYSTAQDLAIFGAQFLKPGFISDSIYQQIYQPHVSVDGTATQFSDGWVLVGLESTPRVLFFGGSYPGTTAILAVYPDNDMVITLVTNTWGKNASNWTFPLLTQFGAAIGTD